jgi:hypothetical protein
MATLAPALLTFNGGEWSDRLLGRLDLARYQQAGLLCQNFLPLVQGPLTRRPGTAHVAPVRGNTATVRLIPFVFSADQTYVIEATALKFRFYRGGASRGPVVESAKSISAITKANPAVVTSSGHGFQNGDEVLVSGVAGMTEVNNRRFKVAGRTSNTFNLTDLDGNNVDSTGYTTYSGSGSASRIYELTTTYDADDLASLSFDQSADVIYIGCPGFKPRKLTRLGDTNWTLADVTFTDGPYLPENSTTTYPTINPDGGSAGSSVTITFTSTTGINDGAGFTSADVGRFIRCLRREVAPPDASESHWSWFQITSVSSSTVVVATAKSRVGYEFGSLGLRRRWRIGSWSDTLGWPSKVVLFQGRAWWASSATYPLTLWASESDQFESFAPSALLTLGAAAEPTASNAFFLTLAGGQRNIIRWLLPSTNLLVGSGGDERSIRGGDLSEIVSFDNAAARVASNVGCHDALPARVDSAALFLSRDQRKLYELSYRVEIDNYAPSDLSLAAEHIGQESQIEEITFQRQPWSILWARRSDGLLVGFTYDRNNADQPVLAWHRHPLGGTAAKVLAMTCIPGDGQDELWLVVERTINNVTRRQVEYLTYEPVRGATYATDHVYLDASLTYDGSAATTIGGLEHLAGETVQVLADGAVHDDVTVSSIGRITLDRAASVVHVGYNYTSRFETMPLEIGNPAGAAIGRPKTLHAVTLLLVDTVGGEAGPSVERLEAIRPRNMGDLIGTASPLRTHRFRVRWRGGWDDPVSLVVQQALPLPLTLAAAVPHYQVSEA